jgi:hypothetical protein
MCAEAKPAGLSVKTVVRRPRSGAPALIAYGYEIS